MIVHAWQNDRLQFVNQVHGHRLPNLSESFSFVKPNFMGDSPKFSTTDVYEVMALQLKHTQQV